MSRENKLLELRGQVRSVVAEIHCTYDRPTDKYCSIIGTVLVANQQFCYLMVRSVFVSDCGSYTVYLPDGSSMEIGPSEFVVPSKGSFAGCFLYHDKLEYDITKIAAARFGENVVDFDEVYLSDFSNGSPKGTCLNVLGGRAIEADATSFTHECGTTFFISNGSPVFIENGELAGICTHTSQGIATALNASTIKRSLNHIYNTKNIEEFYKKVLEFSKKD